jgi:hypothetical protein
MSSFRIRPRFQQLVKAGTEEVEQLFKDRIAHEQDQCPCFAVFRPGHIILRIPVKEQHFWSPQLSLSIDEHEEGTLIRGLYGPDPSVWTFFAMGYLTLGIASVFVAIIGYSYHMLNKDASLLWLLPVFGVLALVLYLIAQFGQKLGAEQTFRLHHYFEETLGKRIPID